MSNGGPGKKRMYVGPGHAGEVWEDLLSPSGGKVRIDKRGIGTFPVGAMTVGVWVDAVSAGKIGLQMDLYVSHVGPESFWLID